MELEPGVREALDEVRAKGEQDGNEHLILLRDGQVVFRKDGDEHMVDVEDQRSLFKQGDVVVHNHPNLIGLSDGDLGMAQTAGAKAVYAITTDGSIYKGRLKAPWFVFAQTFPLELDLFVADPLVVHAALSTPNFEERIFDPRHWAFKALKEQGIIEYEWEFGPETENLISEFTERLNAWKVGQ